MEDKYPIYQWSKFINDGEQVVVRGNSFEQFVLDVQATRKQFTHVTIQEPVVEDPVPTQTIVQAPSPAQTCAICSGPATIQEGINKNGGPYRLLKCSKDYKHNKFL